ncbi:MAG: addiction module toxin RelE [Salinivirgaceae bacterium]|nr:addiction module toxin RelE [Salinivirgaceae bacterium]
MKYEFYVTNEFNKQLKRLSKKYKSITLDLLNFRNEFEQKYPLVGVDLGGGYRKIRLEIKSKNKGKSGGARIITYDLCLNIEENTKKVLLVTIFDKSDFENINDKLYKKVAMEYLFSML